MLGRVKRGELKLSEAARMLAISDRQRKRFGRRYSAGETRALKHGNVGRISKRAKPAEVRKRVLQLVRAHYSGEPKQRGARQVRQPAADHPWRRPLLSRKRKTAKSSGLRKGGNLIALQQAGHRIFRDSADAISQG